MFKIAVGDYTHGGMVFHDRVLGLSEDASGVDSETIPWESRGNPFDYRYEGDEFIYDPPNVPDPSPKEYSAIELLGILIGGDDVVE